MLFRSADIYVLIHQIKQNRIVIGTKHRTLQDNIQLSRKLITALFGIIKGKYHGGMNTFFDLKINVRPFPVDQKIGDGFLHFIKNGSINTLYLLMLYLDINQQFQIGRASCRERV